MSQNSYTPRLASHQKLRLILCVLIATCAQQLFGAMASAEPITVEQLTKVEKAAIESRKSIKSGHFVVSVKYKKFAADPRYKNYELRYEIFKKARKSRADITYNMVNNSSKHSIIFTDDIFIRAPLTGNGPVQYFGPTRRPKSTIEVPDPRRLGLISWNFASINQFGFEEYLLNPQRSNISIEVTEQDGEPVWKVECQFDEGDEPVSAEYWLAIEKGYQPVYVASKSGEEEDEYFYSARSELVYHKDEDVWFPSEVTTIIKHAGIISSEEVATVEIAKLNTKIDDKKFGLSDLGLAVGRLVVNDSKNMWWTGKRLRPKYVGEEQYQGDELPTAVADSGRRSLLLLANAVILAFLAIAALWKRSAIRR